jgi:ring-1,2-phenylacetyl-CoA epoxidase subunit PaaC
MQTIREELRTPLVELLFSIADDMLMLGHRDSDWTGLAPILEEDIAFSSMAQDEIGHASALYEFVAQLRGAGTTPDALAYGREPAQYRCAELTWIEDGFDWAAAIIRQYFCDHHDLLRLERLSRSSHAPLAAIGRRLLAEERIHIGHGDGWVRRLGRGDAESRRRMQTALDRLAPLAGGPFEPTAGVEALEREGVYPPLASDTFEAWSKAVQAPLHEAGLRFTARAPEPTNRGGRSGRHAAGFDAVLREMTEVYRLEPQAQW